CLPAGRDPAYSGLVGRVPSRGATFVVVCHYQRQVPTINQNRQMHSRFHRCQGTIASLPCCSMATVGEQLRRAREDQSLSVSQIADITKIKGDHIRALEQGDHDAFPAPVYVRGCVRTCATLLKLDAAALLTE